MNYWFRLFWYSVTLLLISLPVMAECALNRVDLRGDWGQATFKVEIADTPESQVEGLMHRKSLPRRNGMLFIFDQPRKASFWMKNTLIPLDMLFFDERGVLTDLAENTVPLTTDMLVGGDNTLSVLEINGGISALYGIIPGTEIRHPSLSKPDVAWRCQLAE